MQKIKQLKPPKSQQEVVRRVIAQLDKDLKKLTAEIKRTYQMSDKTDRGK